MVNLRLLLVDQTVRYAQEQGIDTLMNSNHSVDVGTLPWETYITSLTNTYMFDSIDDAGVFRPYHWNLYQCRNPL